MKIIDTPYRLTCAAVMAVGKNRCFYCGRAACEVDHVVAIRKGGPNSARNLVPACRYCNRMKGAKWLRNDILEETLLEASIRAEEVTYLAEIMQRSVRMAEDRIEVGSLPLTSKSTECPDGETGVVAARTLQRTSEEIAFRYFGAEWRQKSKVKTSAVLVKPTLILIPDRMPCSKV